jgi:hypothetical protein
LRSGQFQALASPILGYNQRFQVLAAAQEGRRRVTVHDPTASDREPPMPDPAPEARPRAAGEDVV